MFVIDPGDNRLDYQKEDRKLVKRLPSMIKGVSPLTIPTILWLWSSLWVNSVPMIEGSDFTVYWNVPSKMCHKHGVYINASKYGMVQNAGDEFIGDRVITLYHPGKFPHLEGGVSVNGGIPQNGSIEEHMDAFRSQVDSMLEDFKGIAALDFEAYRPGFSQAPLEYRKSSRDWVSSLHPTWTAEEIDAEARKSFNESARLFMEVLLQIGMEKRPNALWGYYHYPYCKNNHEVECLPNMMEFNDETMWLYSPSTGAHYPSIYLFNDREKGAQGRKEMALGRLREAQRLNVKLGKNLPIIPYCHFLYHSSETYITTMDLINTVGLAKMEGMQGAIMWGSSADVSSAEKCTVLQEYVDRSLGPLVQYIIQMPKSLLGRALNSQKLLQKITAMALDKFNTTG